MLTDLVKYLIVLAIALCLKNKTSANEELLIRKNSIFMRLTEIATSDSKWAVIADLNPAFRIDENLEKIINDFILGVTYNKNSSSAYLENIMKKLFQRLNFSRERSDTYPHAIKENAASRLRKSILEISRIAFKCLFDVPICSDIQDDKKLIVQALFIFLFLLLSFMSLYVF